MDTPTQQKDEDRIIFYVTLFRSAKSMFEDAFNWNGSMPNLKSLDRLDKALTHARGAYILDAKDQPSNTYIREARLAFEEFKKLYPDRHIDDKLSVETVRSCFDSALFYIEETRKELGYIKQD